MFIYQLKQLLISPKHYLKLYKLDVKNIVDVQFFPRWRWGVRKQWSKWLPIGLVLLFCELGQYPAIWPNILIFATIISFVLSITLRSHPLLPRISASFQLGPHFKHTRKCVESLSSTRREKNVMVDIRLCLDSDGRLYASPECLECKMQKS